MPKIGLVVNTRTRLDEPFRDLVIAREIIAEMQETGALRVPSSILNDFTHGTPAPVCGACLTTPMDAHGLVCASCTSEMTAGESAKRQGSTGHEAAGLGYTPQYISQVLMGKKALTADLSFRVGYIKLPDAYVRAPKGKVK